MITMGTKWEIHKTRSFGSKTEGDKFRYHSEKLCIAKFRRDCEIFAMVEKFSQSLRNFRNPCEIFAMHSEKSCTLLHPLVFSSASISSIPLDITSTRLDEIAENSYEYGINRHQLEAKLEMMVEAHKTCKVTKNEHETKSVVLNGPAHVNWLNSYD